MELFYDGGREQSAVRGCSGGREGEGGTHAFRADAKRPPTPALEEEAVDPGVDDAPPQAERRVERGPQVPDFP